LRFAEAGICTILLSTEYRGAVTGRRGLDDMNPILSGHDGRFCHHADAPETYDGAVLRSGNLPQAFRAK